MKEPVQENQKKVLPSKKQVNGEYGDDVTKDLEGQPRQLEGKKWVADEKKRRESKHSSDGRKRGVWVGVFGVVVL